MFPSDSWIIFNVLATVFHSAVERVLPLTLFSSKSKANIIIVPMTNIVPHIKARKENLPMFFRNERFFVFDVFIFYGEF